MSTPVAAPDTSTYDYNSFPFLAPRTTASRMRHFSEDVYNLQPSTHLYNIVDALCGDGGAGSLKKELLFAHFNQNLDSIFFRDLDNIFGKIASLARYASEAYDYDPASQLLTTDQWNEVMVKDAWYRQRIKDFMFGIGLGGTPQGMRLMCRAALAVDCELYEVAYYKDSSWYTAGTQLGRTAQSLRNELVLRPLKANLSPAETYLLNGLCEQTKPVDTVLTIDPLGLAIHTPVTIKNVAADSSYFQVEKDVTGVPDLAKLPPPQALAQDLQIDPSYMWMQPNTKVPAPYAAWTTSQESSQFYYYSYSNTTAIDTVIYCEDTGDVRKLHFTPFSYYRTNAAQSYGPWQPFDLADSPDNYPGGKMGQTPYTAPALTKSGQPYTFPYASQLDFVNRQSADIIKIGGQVSMNTYRVPITRLVDTDRRTWDPTLAIPLNAPTQDCTVQTQWLRRPTDSYALAQYQRQVFAQGTFVQGGI